MTVRASMADLIARTRRMTGDPSGTPATYSAWQATHAFAIGDQRRPNPANGHFYRVTVPGTSGGSQPTFPTDGGSVIDGTAVWTDQGLIPSGTSTFTDQDIQDALDARRTDVVEAQLRTRPSFTQTSLVIFADYFAPRRFWEDSVVLKDHRGAVLTPDTADLTAGHWTFTAGQALPVYITGSFYDLYGAAQAICEEWAAIVARDFDFSTDQQDFSRSQKSAGLLAIAREYARKAVMPGPRPGWRSLDW